MLVTFYCDLCEAKLRINADAMGSDLICPECDTMLQVPRMQLGPGFVVGGFLIKHKLGEGGMGEVYLATQLSLERDIALKILPSRFTRENSFVVRFLKEVHYQAKLDHPNIVAAYDGGEDNGVYFMAMAYVEGETLEERLDREGTLPEKDALQVVRQVAKALEYASVEKGILHRDIKPANIMLTPSLHAKVLDMGLSKNTMEKKSTTLADTLMGTPNYMSPEQIDHPQELDTRSDMFSLGMTLYHMLTGQIPFEESGYLKTLHRHAKEKLEDPRDLMPGIAPGSAHLLARMLARDPDDRYPDWQTFQEDLQGVLSKKSIPKPPEGESTLDLNPPPPPQVQKKIHQTSPRRHYSPAQTNKSPKGIFFSVAAGLTLGVLGILLIASQVQPPPGNIPRQVSLPETVATPTPEVFPDPTPALIDFDLLQRELTNIILNYERNRDQHDQVIKDLLDLAQRGTDTSISENAARQIVRVRRDRDAALEAEQQNLRKTTIRILYDQSPEAARAHLKNYESPFRKDLTAQIGNLYRRIRIREKQETSQREEEKIAAAKALDELHKQLAPLLIQREWASALEMLDDAAKEPVLFPKTTDLSSLREEVLRLQAVPHKIIDSYAEKLNQEILLKLKDKDLTVTIRELKPDGLLVGRNVFAEDGSPLGTAELFISFNSLSTTEILDQLENLEGPEILTYRALLVFRRGEKDAARSFLEVSGTPLAHAIRDQLFSLPTLNSFMPDGSGSPSSMPQFSPLPRLE